MRVLCCGSREWTKAGIIRRVLSMSGATEIIHGDCRGADRMCGEIAHSMGLVVRAFPANWKLYGKAAGPIRNEYMLDTMRPDMVIAFHENISESKGTAHMVKIARNAGIPVKIITGGNE